MTRYAFLEMNNIRSLNGLPIYYGGEVVNGKLDIKIYFDDDTLKYDIVAEFDGIEISAISDFNALVIHRATLNGFLADTLLNCLGFAWENNLHSSLTTH